MSLQNDLMSVAIKMYVTEMHKFNNKVHSVQGLFETPKQVGDLNASPIDHTGRHSLVVTTVHVSR